MNELKCRFSDSGRGFGFAELLDGSAEDIFIAPDDTLHAMTNDIVLVHRFSRGEAGYTRGNEGQVIKIVERGNSEIIGTFRMRGAEGVVFPDDNRLHAEVRIPGRDIAGAKDGDKVCVKITAFPKKHRGDDVFRPEGFVIANFGRAETREANYAAVLHKNGIPTTFSDEMLWEAEDAAARPVSSDGRLDLRGEIILTIDGAGAKDLDDAISVTRHEGGWTLGVHIADVSHYVPEGGAVDREAYARGTSVYFVDKVVPMLPEALSNGICSLNGGVDRYALSAIIELDESGSMTGCDFKKSVIRSRMRGVYEEVNDLFENGKASAFAPKYAEVYDTLCEMRRLYEILRAAADKRGQLSMESPEAEILLDEKGLPTDILPRTRGIGEMMIEQFMLAANVAAATWLTERGLPCLYRVHEDPLPEKMQSFAVFAHNMDLDTSELHGDVDPLHLQKILAEAEEKGVAEIVSGVMLRSLAKARYSERRDQHFGLALPLYAHFTSPIRRYPDLFVHRAISSALTGSRVPSHPAESARVSTEAEIRATTAERAIEDLYMAQYASFHLEEEFEGTVSSVCSFGIFVRTDKLFEGLVADEKLFPRGVRPEYSEEHLTLSGGGRTYRLGQRVRIKVERAEVESGQIDFVLAGEDAVFEEPIAPVREKAPQYRLRQSGKGSRPGTKSRENKGHGSRGRGHGNTPMRKNEGRPAKKGDKKTAFGQKKSYKKK